MNSLPFKLSVNSLLFISLSAFAIYAQDWESTGSTETDPFGGDPFGGLSGDTTSSSDWSTTDTATQQTPDSESGASSVESTDPSSISSDNNPVTTTEQISSSSDNPIQNAIIEGVQLSSEKGETDDEKIVSGYFIFRDKPTSYFYETNLREKKLIFEFNDTRVGSSPVPSASEAPIKGFTIEQGKVDINKSVKGLKPEWHDMIRIIFDLEALPVVHVNDEFSIVSFSFKWTTDPAKVEKYTVKSKKPKVIILSSAGVAGLGVGALVFGLLTRDPGPVPKQPIGYDDLPKHNDVP